MATTLTRCAIVHKRGSPSIARPELGWEGSLAATKGDIVFLSSGVVTHGCNTSATLGTTQKSAILNQDIAVGLVVTSVVEIEKLDDDTLFEMPVATSSGASLGTPASVSLATLKTLIGGTFDISRDSLGSYYVNTNLASNQKVEIVEIGSAFGAPLTLSGFWTVKVRFLATMRVN